MSEPPAVRSRRTAFVVALACALAPAVARAADEPPPPARALFAPAAVLLSVDDALHLVSFGSASPLAPVDALQIGEGTSFGPRTTTPKLPFADVVLAHGITVGGTVAPSFRFGASEYDGIVRSNPSIFGVHLRGGIALPISERLALWPRVGFAHTRGFGTTPWLGRTDLELDARLAYALDRDVALTFGLGAVLPLSTERPDVQLGAIDYGARSAAPGLAASFGFTARLDDHTHPPGEDAFADPRAPLPSGTLLLGVDRLVEVFAYEHDTMKRDPRPGDPPDVDNDRSLEGARVGLFDTRNVLPRAPRLSADVLVGRFVTVGASAGLGTTKSTSQAALVPPSGAQSTLAWSIAPRVGAMLPIASRFSVWPRVGVTWAESHGKRQDVGDTGTHEVALDGDLYATLRVTARFFVAAGPSVSVPLWGRTDEITTPFGSDRATIRRGDFGVLHAGLGGMLGLTL